MRSILWLVLATACTPAIDDVAGIDAAPIPPDRSPVPADAPSPEPSATLPDGTPRFLLPFPCGEAWQGQTRTNHSPTRSIDFNRAGDEGDPVLAAAAGTVTRVENLGATSYGRWIELRHASDHRTRYAHLDTQLVTVGQTVMRGQPIGTVGNTGGSTGAHLHYEARRGGAIIDVAFDGEPALYYGTRTYTSTNSCLP